MEWIVDVQSTANGWEVRLLDASRGSPANDAAGQPLLALPRLLGRAVTSVGNFPLPPADKWSAEVDEVRTLCGGTDLEFTAKTFRELIQRSISAERMKSFGRYLFLTLLGNPLWQKLDGTAGQTGVELILAWPPEDIALTRLPWEMMHGATDFLMAEKRFSLARQVAGAAPVVRALSTPPRVLFVIGGGGSDRHFDGLKPGAEYLGLLRGLRQGSLGLKHLPLVSATSKRLKAAVENFRPDVVHFICHGDPEGSLELVDDNHADMRMKVDADALYRLLHPADPALEYTGPQIVVLSACYSAGTGGVAMENAGQVGFPLAVQLVRKGVPVVVGMAGEVADQACRLFGRSFYESLLTDGKVAAAAARGRRAGLLHAPSGRSRVDWTLPTLFVSADLRTTQVQLQHDPAESAWHKLAEELAPPAFPGYYARLDLLRFFELLMLDEAEQKKIDDRPMDLQVLGLSTVGKNVGIERYGRTWAVKDLASKAARDGHVPIVLDKDYAVEGRWPVTLPELISFLIRASRATVEILGLSTLDPGFGWVDTLHLQNSPVDKGLPPGLPAEISGLHAVGDEGERLDMTATAMRRDLLSFLDTIRRELSRPKAKLLLLIDDVHQMGDIVAFFLKRLLGIVGFRAQRARRDDLRVIFTYSQVPEQPGQQPAIKAISDFLSEKNYAADLSLTGFRDPTESRLAYENFFFRWRKAGKMMSLVPVLEKKVCVDWFFEQFHKDVAGVPSKLLDPKACTHVDFVVAMPPEIALLRVADDEDALSKTV